MLIHRLATTYGQRPSSIIGIKNEWEALEWDMAIMMCGLQQEKLTMDEAAKNNVDRPPDETSNYVPANLHGVPAMKNLMSQLRGL